MINRLTNIPFRVLHQTIRLLMIMASIVLGTGVAAIGLARTPEIYRTQMHSVSQSTLHSSKKASVELLRDVSSAPELKPTSKLVTMEVTAYCACTKCCGPNAQGLTASGKDVSYNESKFVAADRSMAFGTKMLIPGYDAQPVEVIDRGGAIKGNRLDVFFPTHQQALEWGRRTVAVTVFE